MLLFRAESCINTLDKVSNVSVLELKGTSKFVFLIITRAFLKVFISCGLMLAMSSPKWANISFHRYFF